MDNKLIEKIVKELKEWEEEGKGYISPFSYDGIAHRLIPLIAGEILGEVESWGEGDIYGDARGEYLLFQPSVKQWQSLRTRFGLPEKEEG